MTPALVSLIQMSLSGGALILAALLIRALGLHRLPKRFLLSVWDLALARLLIPFSLPAACSVYSLVDRRATDALTVSAPAAAPPSPLFPGGGTLSSAAATGGTLCPIDPWSALWLIGLLACALYFGAAYVKCRREFRESLPVSCPYGEQWLQAHRLRRPIALRQSDRITAPLTYGVLRPVILLPKSTDWDDQETLGWVLAHEWNHIRCFDGVRKLLLLAALSAHWFNPLVWAMVFLASRDMELACDAAVLRQSGLGARSGYAMALIRMEEGKAGLPVLGNHFSRNSIEERIRAIMKIQKKSLAALLAAVALVGGTGAVFATSAKAEVQNTAPGSYYTAEKQEADILIRDNSNGTASYSTDGGETWTSMTDEELTKFYSNQDIQWWTAEEYAAWLENEKKVLQTIIGSQGWTSGTGWFTWTQEMVDETIAKYEEILAMIENGYLVSKTVDGDENTMLISGGPMQATETGEGEVVEKGEADYASLFEEYKRWGLTFQNNDGSLYWNGQRVRIFVDGAEFGGGYVSQYEHYDLEGVIDVRTVRERVDNGDGSYDPMGPLVRLEEFEPDQMFLDALEGQRYVGAEIQYEAEHTAKELERYAPFGLTGETDITTGKLSMTWNGQPVRSLFDPERQLWLCNSLGTKGLDIEAVYKDGRLTGLRESEESISAAAGVVIDEEAAAAESDGNDGSGETIAQRMARYAPYGVSYQERGGKKLLRYNGQAVNSFADITPDGGVFSVGSTDGGEIDLVTVYDEDGRLNGVKAYIAYRF